MKGKLYKEAKERVEKKKEFYKHFSTYVVVSIFLIALNMMTAPWVWWFKWPVLGWGIGILFHYFDAFGFPGMGDMSSDWEERQVREEMRKLQERNGMYEEDDYDTLELPELEKRQKKNYNDDELV